MAERPTNRVREAILDDDRAGPLTPDQEGELALLADVLADSSTWVEPPAGFEDRVVAAITAAQADAREPAGARAAAATAPRVGKRGRLAIVAVAATAAVLLAVGALAVGTSTPSADYRSELAATELAPGAGGSLEVRRNTGGFELVLDAHGLPPLTGGEYYQGWLKAPSGELVPVGSFSSSDGPVTLWSGLSPTDFPAFTVTIEATDGNPASSGRRVLAGDVRPV